LQDDLTSGQIDQCVSLTVLTVTSPELEPCTDYYILQLAFMSRIDNLSNKTMKIGTVAGSNSSIRGQGNWKDYLLLNNLFEELKLTSHEGDLVLDTFRRILIHYEVNVFAIC
jgi:hypothetical protein